MLKNVLKSYKMRSTQKKQIQKERNEYVPNIKNVLSAYHETDDIKKNRLLKSVLEKATYLRKKADESKVELFPRI
jgi:site-specific DNA recombinase